MDAFGDKWKPFTNSGAIDLLWFRSGLAATFSDITYNTGNQLVQAASAAHPPNTSSEFREHQRRTQQSNSSGTAAAYPTDRQEEGLPLLGVPPFQLGALAGSQVNREPCAAYRT